jgi:predicted dienelactone hydrolase
MGVRSRTARPPREALINGFRSCKGAHSLRARVGAWLLIAAAANGATFGCAGKPSGKSDAAAVKAHANAGYTPERRYQTTALQDTWLIESEPVDIRLLVPAQAGSYPLVFYFPGLGESPDAGLAWRQSWAQAGYAVLSAQPVKYGAAVWSSDRARVGDFLDIARDAFAAPSLATRTGLARALLDETWRRARSAQGTALGRIDMSRVAVAGYDLGAQTAMMIAGESVQGVELLQVPEGVKCVVALSPYADFSGMGTESNFSSIRLPVLSVTSAQDTDAYGLVKSAAVRRAPYQYMPANQKYLLVLSGAPHSLLAGTAVPAQGSPESGSEAEAEPGLMSEKSSASDESRGHKKRQAPSSSKETSSARRAIEVAQVQSVTTAFLDATVKNDPIGSEWLSRNAQRWLGESADLRSK